MGEQLDAKDYHVARRRIAADWRVLCAEWESVLCQRLELMLRWPTRHPLEPAGEPAGSGSCHRPAAGMCANTRPPSGSVSVYGAVASSFGVAAARPPPTSPPPPPSVLGMSEPKSAPAAAQTWRYQRIIGGEVPSSRPPFAHQSGASTLCRSARASAPSVSPWPT